jgi:S-adenosylmethionine:tRNA ribosyltransferase-isomerase
MPTDAATPFLDFVLPSELEASEPPEAHGLPRDSVRLMVSYRDGDRVEHVSFVDLPDYLHPGDVLAVNTSGTLNASLPATLPNNRMAELHLSTRLPGDIWTVELRVPANEGSAPLPELDVPATVQLPFGGVATIHDRYHCGCGDGARTERLWTATLELPLPLMEYLDGYGRPIRYHYVTRDWPGTLYQTAFATERGSAEMPSAGRAFTPRVLQRLGERGITLAPLLLHTGVASPEVHEPPYEEYFRVSGATANRINQARASGRRVIAVGTTVVRALETVVDAFGEVHSGEGWTCTVVTPERGARSVDGLLTGFHEPRASHLLMLEAIAGREHLVHAYAEALDHRYLWHEFGDLHLIL